MPADLPIIRDIGPLATICFDHGQGTLQQLVCLPWTHHHSQIKRLVRDLAGDTTILLIEHNMSVVMETADIVTVLNFGAVLAEGTPDAIRSDPDVQAAYLGTG